MAFRGKTVALSGERGTLCGETVALWGGRVALRGTTVPVAVPPVPMVPRLSGLAALRIVTLTPGTALPC